jgi:exopolyphosphatase/guanosine-5'-triphosphate,3'-diphosphate pyrophosphatase
MRVDADAVTQLGWSPFSHDTHETWLEPEARALSRVGVIDVGSNSVRMVVFDGAARAPAYFYNEKVMCGLGAGLSRSGKLNPEGRLRAAAAIARFVKIAQGMKVTPLIPVATAAIREASDGPAFCSEIEANTGLKLWVIDGAEEARLSAQGVLLGWPGADGIMCDIGGSSMEIAEITKGTVGRCATSALGPLKLADVKGGKKGLRAHIKTELAGLAATVPVTGKRLYLVGGSWRALARLDMLRQGYPLAVLHEYEMKPKAIRATMDWVEKHDLEDLRQRTGIGHARISLIPKAMSVLRPLLATFKPSSVAVSSFGIREGLLYEEMSEGQRRRDPLIEASRFTEARSARMPGFGKALYDFLAPLYRSAKPDQLRIVRAACHLHDVGWRAHPDYRSEVVFDIATQANLAGMTHSERVFLGLSLLHRYKNSRSGSRFEPLFSLISDDDKRRAEILGKALRFGAMLAAQEPGFMGALKWFPKKRELELHLTPDLAVLHGEVSDARFRSLAKSLEAEARVLVR